MTTTTPVEPKARHHVLVSKLPGEPVITIDVVRCDADPMKPGMEIRLSLDDFVTQLVSEVGSPAFVFRSGEFARRIREAAAAVVLAMKDETKRT